MDNQKRSLVLHYDKRQGLVGAVLSARRLKINWAGHVATMKGDL